MNKLTRTFNKDENFWDVNPNFTIVKEFKELHSKLGKKKSSNVMWAVALLIDGHDDNPFKNLSFNEKKELILSDFVEVKDFNWDNYKGIIDKYIELCLSNLERSKVILEQKISERNKLLKELEYSVENVNVLDSIILNGDKINSAYMKIVEEVEKENVSRGATKGGRMESASEAGLL